MATMTFNNTEIQVNNNPVKINTDSSLNFSTTTSKMIILPTDTQLVGTSFPENPVQGQIFFLIAE